MNATIDELINKSRNGNKPKLLLKTGERVELTGHDGEAFRVRSLGGKHEGKTARMSDELLMKACEQVEERETIEKAPVRVLFEQDRDDWPEELERRKQRARASIERVNTAPSWKVPTHPVVVVFRNRPDDEPANARAKLIGPEIHIYDPSDPLTEFLHELSHAYWLDRLNEDERARWNDIAGAAGKNPPRLPGEMDTGEHCFAIAYCLGLKAEMLDEGYDNILKSLWPDARLAITDLFKSVERQEGLERNWSANRYLLLAAIEGGMTSRAMFAPERLEKAGSEDGIDWLRDGNMMVPTRNGRVDFGMLRRARGGMLVRRGRAEVLIKASASGKLYVDLDGVLVNFMKGVRELGHDTITDRVWTDISKTPNFWQNLDWTSDGKRLWSRIKRYDPIVLTSVKMSAGRNQAIRGKKRWVEDNLGKNVRVVVTGGEKSEHARRGDVLIDDDYSGEILSGWSAAGGTSIKHESAASTLKKLDDLGLK